MSTDKKIGEIMTENGDIDLSFIDNLDEEFPEINTKVTKPQKAPPSEVKETNNVTKIKDIDPILKDLPSTKKKLQPVSTSSTTPSSVSQKPSLTKPTPTKPSNHHPPSQTLEQKAIATTPKVSPLSPLIEAIINPHTIIKEEQIKDIIKRLDPDGNGGIWNRDIVVFILRNVIFEILLIKEKSFKDDPKLKKLCKEGSRAINSMIEDVASRDLFYDEKTLFSKFANAITKEVMEDMDKSSSNKFILADWLNGQYPKEKEKEKPRCTVSGEVIKPDEFFHIYHCLGESFLFKGDSELVLAYAFKHVVLLPVTIRQFVNMYIDKFKDRDAKGCIEELRGGVSDDEDDDYCRGAFFNDLLAPFNDYACVLKLYSGK